ncbi:unnamed protein product [Cylindrotheca closterium]|uniref:DUF6824 domain-containing protein n=1 Tax=Cylindrotheca closterium TaxID=2856 RepID=A0AAD2FKF5_9STRA|nr:unnamed protein product [Cylindrotheca closterium]
MFANFQRKEPSAIMHAGHRQRQQNHEGNEMKETEELLASELSKLSVQERAKALDDLHCVGEELQETPEMIQHSLSEFDYLVQTCANRIYSVAVNQNRAYVQDSEFRLKFLRANMYDTRKSVHQMMSFLQQKALYFGEDKVAHDIAASDLNEDEIELMRSGFCQIQEGRDRNGRVVVFNSFNRMPTRFRGMRDENFAAMNIRVVYHIVFNMLSSIPEVQTKGIVKIYYDESNGGDSPSLPGFNFFSQARQFGDTLPIFISSLHICLHSSPGSLALHNRMLQFLLKALPQSTRTRARLHYGSDLERQYKLRGYGIPLDTFPVDTSGNIRAVGQNTWCKGYLGNGTLTLGQQGGHESAAMAPISGGISEADILFGRGRLVQYHHGNIRFRELLGEHIEEYENLPRNQRRKASVVYTRELVASGARFLKENGNDGWIVCDFEEAVGKVLQFYRTSRRNRK